MGVSITNRERALQGLFDGLYEAAIDPSRWSQFLRQLAKQTNGNSAALVLNDFGNTASSVEQQFGLSSDGPRLYAEHYGKFDVWTQRAHTVGFSWTGRSEDLCPRSKFVRTEFYNDFLRRDDIFRGIFSIVKNSASSITSISVYKDAKRDFSDADLQILHFLTPHMSRALRVHSEFSRVRDETGGLNDALDALPTAVFLLGHRGAVVGMNVSATKLASLNDGLLMKNNCLSVELRSESDRLKTLVNQAIATSLGRGLSPTGTMRVSRKSSGPLHVCVAPVPPRSQLASEHKVLALVFVSDPDKRAVHPPEALRALYGLTPAESRVAIILANGKDLRAACGELSITYATSRAHLRNIFQKVGVRRQAELTSRLLRVGVLPLSK